MSIYRDETVCHLDGTRVEPSDTPKPLSSHYQATINIVVIQIDKHAKVASYTTTSKQSTKRPAMRIPNIYTPLELSEHKQFDLDDSAAAHLIKVLRMKEGEQLRLFNGSGKFFPATIIQASKKQLRVQTNASEAAQTESCLKTHLGQVISRGDRMDYSIQKSTEMGVSEITPLFSERCEVKLNPERQAKRLLHWQQISISAAEQCGRATVPIIHSPMRLEQWTARQQGKGLSLVLHHRDTQKLSEISPAPNEVNLLIGPEGGLSAEEIAAAQGDNFLSTTFGPRVLRTETASVTSLSIVQWLWGDLAKV